MCDKERKDWIDSVKAICMLGVYLLHSEAYYGTGGVSYGYALTPFYVNAFFFVSGYLFLGKRTGSNMSIFINRGGVKRDLANVWYRLVVPTLLFSSLLYLPKMLFQGADVDMGHYLFEVWGGISSWFTSALAVAQMVLILLLPLGFRSSRAYVLVTFVLSGLGLYLNTGPVSNDAADYFPWFYKTGLVYVFVMVAGGIYCRYEEKMDSLMTRRGWPLVGAVYAGILISTWETHSIKAIGISGHCNLSGLLTLICGIALLIMITKRMKRINWLAFIGKNSIVFYFFSGAIPAVCSAIIGRAGFEKNYILTIIVAILSITISSVIAKVVERYMPFLTDLRKLKQ
ncbi:acyltransferase family protein [Bacteroides intestinalis]|jgi:hypothetical protein|nr:acyltransferase [Bacteroides intestinalis]